MAQFVSVVLADTEKTWHGIFRQYGKTYREPAADAGLLEGLLLDLIEKSCGIRSTLVSPLTWRPQKE